LLKALAIPLILFAILDAFVQTRISARSGWRLLRICLFNAAVALTIGLCLINTLQPGLAWKDHLQQMTGASEIASAPKPSAQASLDPLKNVDAYVPQSLLEQFISNNVISVVLIALLFGAALQWFKQRQLEDSGEATDMRVLETLITAIFQVLLRVLGWVVEIVPFAVFGLVAHVVGRSGIGVFSRLGVFLGVISLGLLLHGLVYYPLAARLAGGKSVRDYLGKGLDAILTGLSTNSSLATVPITLRCLQSMRVSDSSARLAVCAGTNLNNDGVTLYEAMTALFLAQAAGFALDWTQQITIVLSAMMAGFGVAGIPEAGLIVLPLVLGAAGLPETLVAAAIPLIAPVDWIIARLRSAVNVLSDMLVAILLDKN
jgi:DAACS family dicarboxylate/amino acid:cation (Na+ or H+) symporter